MPFLETLQQKHGLRMRSVLDLACGTASLVLKLAGEAPPLSSCPSASPEDKGLKPLASRAGPPAGEADATLRSPYGRSTSTRDKRSLRADRIVGIDASPEMLRLAHRKCKELDNVELALGDFRSFDLGEHFDLVLCCFDSLNYIERPEELSDVFRCVERHLQPRGFFVFDVVNERHCLRDDGQAGHYEVAGVPYTFSCRYHPGARVRPSTPLRAA